MAQDPENFLILTLDGGPVVIKLRPDVAPGHVARIKELAREGFYDGVVFHRVIPRFMAQGGDPTGSGMGGSDKPDLPAEFSKEPHVKGVCSMARTNNPDSANSQFFLMRAAFPRLERNYAAFGRVIAGQDVVKAIKVGEPVEEPQDKMLSVRVLTDMPEKDRPKIRVIDPAGKWFKAEVARAQAATGANFTVCDVNIPVEVK